MSPKSLLYQIWHSSKITNLYWVNKHKCSSGHFVYILYDKQFCYCAGLPLDVWCKAGSWIKNYYCTPCKHSHQFLQLGSWGAAHFFCCVSPSLDLVLRFGALSRRTTCLKHLRNRKGCWLTLAQDSISRSLIKFKDHNYWGHGIYL